MVSSDPKGAMSASTPNSSGAPAESPVERRAVRETGRVSDRVHTRQTTAAHTAQDGRRRDPPGTTPSQGPERVRHGASPAPLSRQQQAVGTKSPVLGRPPPAPRSRPVNQGAQAPGLGKGTTASGKPTGAQRATGLDETRRTNSGPRGTPERHAAGHNQGTRTGAKQQRPPGAANPGSAHNPQRTKAHEQVPGKNEPTHQNPARKGSVQAVGAHQQTHANTPARSGGAQPNPEPKHTHPHRAPQPGMAG